MNNTPTIETKRLLLRKFTEDDLPAIYSIFSDVDVNQYLPWFPLKSIDEAKKFWLERYADVYKNPCGYNYAISLKEDNIPVGYVNINMNDSYDLGYGLKKEFWHKGIVFEACDAVVEQAKNNGIPYITATHDINNPRSGNVMKRLGMKYQYSYVEQWQPKDITVTFRMYQMNFDISDTFVYKKYWNTYTDHFIEKLEYA
ncbi:MAG: GNAT family N-acetyltransferase [Clostridium sp.]|nr:GNAT family N-acetyltransferase [Clostridium sp.]